ncbi:hypothetical protein PCHDK_000558700 [Plasmodium chabaudi adami]|nr:hypothetical protein PCHDK_000558700 [Plasmodium chabaudi adami]
MDSEEEEEILNVIRDMVEVRKNLDPIKTAQILEKYQYTPYKSSIREPEIVYMPTPPYNRPPSPYYTPTSSYNIPKTPTNTPTPPEKKTENKNTLHKDPQN